MISFCSDALVIDERVRGAVSFGGVVIVIVLEGECESCVALTELVEKVIDVDVEGQWAHNTSLGNTSGDLERFSELAVNHELCL